MFANKFFGERYFAHRYFGMNSQRAFVWMRATLAAQTPGARVSIDRSGVSRARVLSTSFMQTDGDGDFANIGRGVQVIP